VQIALDPGERPTKALVTDIHQAVGHRRPEQAGVYRVSARILDQVTLWRNAHFQGEGADVLRQIIRYEGGVVALHGAHPPIKRGQRADVNVLAVLFPAIVVR